MGFLDTATGSPFCQALARHVRDRAETTALWSEGRAVPFGALDGRIAAWAAAIERMQVEGLVGVAVGQTPAFIGLFYALRALGLPVVALDAGATPELARRVRAAWLLHRSPSLGGEALPWTPDAAVRLLRLGDPEPLPAGTEIVKMTSGSTLEPRAACFREAALVEGLAHLRDGMELEPEDVVLLAIPLSHSYGFDNGVLSLGAIGTPLVLQTDILPAALLSALRERKATFFPAVPALVRALGQVEWPAGLALRKVVCASAPLAPEDAAAFRRASGVPVRQFYGATEAGGICLEREPDDPAAAGTVGTPLPGVGVELHVDGLRVRSKALRHALLPDGEAAPDFVETGDRGEWTPEGRLRLLGRAHLVANVGGVKVDLGALDAFFRAMPGVSDAAVLTVADPARGDRIVAWVETRSYAPEELLALCRVRLAAKEVPSDIRVRAELPRTERGKLDRGALRGLSK